MEKDATFSECRTWRYTLTRRWAAGKELMVVGLNPSTADETLDDPTIRRCVQYARDWGFGALVMTNLFAFRATDPRDMKRAADPIGPRNGEFLYAHARCAGLVLAAWGAHGAYLQRSHAVMALLDVPVYCLGTTKDGHPRHPLYLRRDAKPERFVQRGM